MIPMWCTRQESSTEGMRKSSVVAIPSWTPGGHYCSRTIQRPIIWFTMWVEPVPKEVCADRVPREGRGESMNGEMRKYHGSQEALSLTKELGCIGLKNNNWTNRLLSGIAITIDRTIMVGLVQWSPDPPSFLGAVCV